MDRRTAELNYRRFRQSPSGWMAGLCLLLCVSGAGCYAPIHSHGIEARTLPNEFRWPLRTTATPLNYSDLVGSAPAVYQLGVGDRLEVTVADLIVKGEVQTFQVQVLDSGEIHLPRSGAVVVDGLSLAEAQQRVNEVLTDGLLQKPDAVVTLLEKGTVNVLVLGAVQQPGVHALPRYENDVAHALAAAQGFAEDAGDVIEIHRRRQIMDTVPIRPQAMPVPPQAMPESQLLPERRPSEEFLGSPGFPAQSISMPLLQSESVNSLEALSPPLTPSLPLSLPAPNSSTAPAGFDTKQRNWAPRPQRAVPAGPDNSLRSPPNPVVPQRPTATRQIYDGRERMPASPPQRPASRPSRYDGYSHAPVFRGQSPSDTAATLPDINGDRMTSPITRIPLRGGNGFVSPNDVVLNAGDVLVVPRKTDKVFYVVGPLSDRNSVRFSVNDRDREIGGGLLLPDDREIDVVTAVVMAGYIDPINSPTTVTLHRTRSFGPPLLIRVDLIAARCDPLENVLVEPGDIIYLNPDPWWYLRRTFDQIIDRGLGTAFGRWLTN